jgi:hypothetical protein
MKKITLFLLLAPFWAFAIDLPTPSPLDTCDDNNDGFSVFDLTQKNAEILGALNPADYSVIYYETLSDAQSNGTPIAFPSAYYNIANPQTIYVRVNNLNDVSDFGVTTLTIRVFPIPLSTTLPYIFLCDPNADGFQNFDISSSVAYALSIQSAPSTAAVFETMADALAGANPLVSPYTNTIAFNQTIYVKVTNNQGCYVIMPLYLIAMPPPVANPINNMIVYQQPFSGTAYFGLYDAIQQVVGNQTNVYANCYATQSEAVAGFNHLPICYTSTSAAQTIWVRVYNTFDFDCYTLTSFTLTVSPDPNPNAIVSIPDANFKTKLLILGAGKNACNTVIDIDANHDGQIQVDEARRVIRLDVAEASIASLGGIKSFENLQFLRCGNNQLTELDLAGMNKLLGLACNYNQLMTLDLSQTGIQALDCGYNELIWVNIKNGWSHQAPPEEPGYWAGNPLEYICVDEEDIPAMEFSLAINSLPTSLMTTNCALLGNSIHGVSSFAMYPNPAQTSVNIQSQSIIRNVIVIDLQGRRVARFEGDTAEMSIDVSGLTAGIYLLHVATDAGQSVQKLVKQ